jgi:hypothetical protein
MDAGGISAIEKKPLTHWLPLGVIPNQKEVVGKCFVQILGARSIDRWFDEKNAMMSSAHLQEKMHDDIHLLFIDHFE